MLDCDETVCHRLQSDCGRPYKIADETDLEFQTVVSFWAFASGASPRKLSSKYRARDIVTSDHLVTPFKGSVF